MNPPCAGHRGGCWYASVSEPGGADSDREPSGDCQRGTPATTTEGQEDFCLQLKTQPPY